MEEEKDMNKKMTKHDVVLRISDTEESLHTKKEHRDSRGSPVAESSSFSPQHKTQMSKGFRDSHAEHTELDNVRNKGQVSTELVTTSRRLLGRSEFSKPKSRMVEPPCPKGASFIEEKTQRSSSSSPAKNSPNKDVTVNTPRDVPEATIVTPRTPLLQGEEEEDDDEEVYKTANIEVSKRSGKKWRIMSFVEWFAFVCIMGFFIASLTVRTLKHRGIWGLELWKWCVLVLVILCGRMVTGGS